MSSRSRNSKQWSAQAPSSKGWTTPLTIPLAKCLLVTAFLSRPSLMFLPSVVLSPSLSARVSIAMGDPKDLKQVFHKAVKKISHVRVVTQLHVPEEDSIMMSHHWLTCSLQLHLDWASSWIFNCQTKQRSLWANRGNWQGPSWTSHQAWKCNFYQCFLLFIIIPDVASHHPPRKVSRRKEPNESVSSDYVCVSAFKGLRWSLMWNHKDSAKQGSADWSAANLSSTFPPPWPPSFSVWKRRRFKWRGE